jgi:hypothetical protein
VRDKRFIGIHHCKMPILTCMRLKNTSLLPENGSSWLENDSSTLASFGRKMTFFYNTCPETSTFFSQNSEESWFFRTREEKMQCCMIVIQCCFTKNVLKIISKFTILFKKNIFSGEILTFLIWLGYLLFVTRNRIASNLTKFMAT